MRTLSCVASLQSRLAPILMSMYVCLEEVVIASEAFGWDKALENVDGTRGTSFNFLARSRRDVRKCLHMSYFVTVYLVPMLDYHWPLRSHPSRYPCPLRQATWLQGSGVLALDCHER